MFHKYILSTYVIAFCKHLSKEIYKYRVVHRCIKDKKYVVIKVLLVICTSFVIVERLISLLFLYFNYIHSQCKQQKQLEPTKPKYMNIMYPHYLLNKLEGSVDTKKMYKMFYIR